MPRLRAFSREWNIGADDLILPMGMELFISGTWIATFASVFFRHSGSFACSGGRAIRSFYTGSLILSSFNVGLLLAVIHESLRGTVINWWPRRRVSALLKAKVVFEVFRILFTIWATKAAYFMWHDCEDYVIHTMRTAVKSSWVAHGFSVVILGQVMNPFDIMKRRNKKRLKRRLSRQGSMVLEETESPLGAIKKVVAQRLRAVRETIGIDNHPGAQNIGQIITDYLETDSVKDLVPLDVMAALVHLQDKQSPCWHSLMNAAFSEQSLPTSGQVSISPQPWMNIAMASHYMKFAAGCYGWPMYVFKSPLAGYGLAKVLARSRYIPRKLPENVVDDGLLMPNTTVIRMTTELDEEDLVYVSFYNDGAEIPFFVAIDHEHQGIVVAIRGTLSLDDILTDLDASASEEVPIPGVKNARAHQGMLNAAQCIQKKLLGHACECPLQLGCEPQRAILDMAWDRLRQCQMGRAKEYRLVIVGHSLGAGVAAILAILMQQHHLYSNLICFSYSPPGGLLTLPAAQYAAKFVCSVILGDDIVGRLGLRSAYSFKMKVLETVRSLDVPKHVIFGDWVEALLNKLLGVKTNLMDAARDGHPSWHSNPQAQQQVKHFQADVDAALMGIRQKWEATHPMYSAGCVIFIRELVNRRSFWRTERSFQSVYTQGDSALFDEVLLTPNIIAHHTPWAVLESLRWMAEREAEPCMLKHH